MNKIVMCLMVMGFLALSAFARESLLFHKNKADEFGKFPDGAPSIYEREELSRHVNYLKTLPSYGGSWFSIPYKKTDSIAVQIVRSSDRYASTKSAALVLCNLNNMKCVNETKSGSLSFVVSGSELNTTKDGKFHFILYGATKDPAARSIVVGLYVCVNKNASLATCTSHCSKKCDHGSCSSVMNACVCMKGYTGVKCETNTHGSPSQRSDHYHDDDDEFFGGFLFGLFVCFCLILIFWCIKACKHSHDKNKQAKAAKAASAKTAPAPAVTTAPAPAPAPAPVPVPIPSATMGYAYYPLGTTPPPPPPPPVDNTCYPVGTAPAQTIVEMSTLPDAAAVYCKPPVGPVAQVPVLILPAPAPKN